MSFVQNSDSQTMIFTMIFVTMNAHRYKLFTNILNDGQTEGKGEIRKYGIATLNIVFLILYKLKG